MIASFRVYDFRDIQKVCGPATGIPDFSMEDKHYLDYICLTFDDLEKTCTAYGCTGYLGAKITVPCEIEGTDIPPYILFKLVKLPAKTHKVSVQWQDKEHVQFTFADDAGTILGTMTQPVELTEPMNYKTLWNGTHNNIYNREHKDGQYVIGFNPRYLIQALSAFKNCDSVRLVFGSAVQPMLIYPGGDNAPVGAEAMVLPVRL